MLGLPGRGKTGMHWHALGSRQHPHKRWPHSPRWPTRLSTTGDDARPATTERRKLTESSQRWSSAVLVQSLPLPVLADSHLTTDGRPTPTRRMPLW